MMNRWCILRTAGRSTLALASSLLSAGFEVWTPTEIANRLVRHGRSTIEREGPAAILPTFVFAREAHHAELAALERDPASRHPAFSIFRHARSVPFIGDAAVAEIREVEATREATRQELIALKAAAAAEKIEREERAAMQRTLAARRKVLRAVRRDFTVGASVSVEGAPAFAGLPGQIVESNGTSAIVLFGGALRMKVEAWQLAESPVEAISTSAA